jgi:uncharacterized protein GlcG (DUF336 family)
MGDKGRRGEGADVSRRVSIIVLALALGAAHPITAHALDALVTAPLTVSDVSNIIAAAATRAKHDHAAAVIAVSDREGNPLGVFDMFGAKTISNDIDIINQTVLPDHLNEVEATALEKARTAAFLSSDQDAFSTLTANTLVGIHFPPKISNTAEAPLFGLQFSQLPCSDVTLGNGTTGALGGIPLYKNGEIAGGIGVDGPAKSQDEVIALAGASKPYSPPSSITANQIYIGGFQLPWTNSAPPKRLRLMPLVSLGMTNPFFPIIPTQGPPHPATPAVFAGVAGEIRYPIMDSTSSASVKLTAADVTTIITQSIARAKATRAAIRQPIGVPARMQVGVTDLDGSILGVFRTNDATMFSLDIVVQKGRTVTAFSDPNQQLGAELREALGVGSGSQIAFSTRTIGFLAQPFYPPGIDGSSPGPLLHLQPNLFKMKPTVPCIPNGMTNGNGITAFPGSTPLYKSGILVGGLGISGDGVDQDDYVANAGAAGYLPDPSIRADQIVFRGTALPFFKFPRQPGL